MARRSRGKRGASPVVKAFFYVGLVLIILAAAISVWSDATGIVSDATASLWLTICFSLTISFAAISYLLHKGKSGRQILKELGLSREALNWRTFSYGLIIFAVYLAIIFGIALFSMATGITVSSNVQQTIGYYPIWALVFIAVISPLNEEIFFRGFLVPRIGVIASGILFAILHFGYGSVSEIVVALWFGLTGGYVFKKTKSLYPSLITHVLVNSITAISLLALAPMLLHI